MKISKQLYLIFLLTLIASGAMSGSTYNGDLIYHKGVPSEAFSVTHFSQLLNENVTTSKEVIEKNVAIQQSFNAGSLLGDNPFIEADNSDVRSGLDPFQIVFSKRIYGYFFVVPYVSETCTLVSEHITMSSRTTLLIEIRKIQI